MFSVWQRMQSQFSPFALNYRSRKRHQVQAEPWVWKSTAVNFYCATKAKEWSVSKKQV
jgi:hypothetical protein